MDKLEILPIHKKISQIFKVPYCGSHGFVYEKRTATGTLKLQFKSLHADRWLDTGFTLTGTGIKSHHLYKGVEYRMHGLTTAGAYCDLIYNYLPNKPVG